MCQTANLIFCPLQLISSLYARLFLPSLLVALVGFEGHLQYLVSEPGAVHAGDGHGRILVVCHGHEAEAFALVGVEVADHLDVVDRAEGPEKLPEHALVRIWGQVVHEDAPPGARVPGDVHADQAGHAVNCDGGEPERGEHGRRSTKKRGGRGLIRRSRRTLKTEHKMVRNR